MADKCKYFFDCFFLFFNLGLFPVWVWVLWCQIYWFLTMLSSFPQLGGSFLLGVGVWVLVDPTGFREIVAANPLLFTGVYVILGMGGMLFLLGFLGCCGAIRENKCLLLFVSQPTHLKLMCVTDPSHVYICGLVSPQGLLWSNLKAKRA